MINLDKNTNKKIIFVVASCILVLAVMLTCLIIPNNTASAEDVTVHGVDASGFFDIYANGDNDSNRIGTVRLNMSTAINSAGKGMFLIQVQVAPRVNHGSNDYKVIQFSLDVMYGDKYGTMTNVSYKDNQEDPVITTSNAVNIVTGPDGTSFQVHSSYTISAEEGSVKSNIVDYEDIPGQEMINKKIHIKVNQPEKDTVINYQIAFFFDIEETDLVLFLAELYDLQVDGIFLAPDYGVNNNDNIFLWGASNGKGEFEAENSSTGHAGKDDGSPNDTLKLIKFNYRVY